MSIPHQVEKTVFDLTSEPYKKKYQTLQVGLTELLSYARNRDPLQKERKNFRKTY